MTKKGWKKERYRHGLASRGIKTLQCQQSSDCQECKIAAKSFDQQTISQILKYNRLSNGKEWIAEFDYLHGKIIINDAQFNDDVDESYLKWDSGDEFKNMGYIHYHPPSIIPKFTAQDFVLACIIHERRRNKDDNKYTYMGLVTPTFIKMVALNPKQTRRKQFEENVETDGQAMTSEKLNSLVDEMRKSGELIEMKTLPLTNRYEKVQGLVV